MAADAADQPLLEVRGLTKRFPGVLALNNVDMTLRHGEVLAVIGENGAGKSTLMKILAGVHQPDDGDILLDGDPIRLDSTRRATACGIALIHQELNLADNLDVGANIFLGREPNRFGFTDRAAIDSASSALLQRVGLDCSTRTLVRTLSIGRQQLVEIAKALSVDARILIMDEPTSSLSQQEAGNLFAVMRDLRDKGTSIIYISHRLTEVHRVADRVMVLRDGENAGILEHAEIGHDAMVRLMVGRDLSQFYPHAPHKPGQAALVVQDLTVPQQRQHRLTFTVHAGEIVGLAGLVGAGRTELLQSIFGIDPPLSGQISVAGRIIRPRTPRDAIRAGMALVPENRKASGLIQELTVRENISLAALHQNRRAGGFLNSAFERKVADEMIARLSISTTSAAQLTRNLSGGNQQKVVLAKWLALRPRVLLLDEPTRGVDVGSKHEIYAIMEQLAGEGVAILFASSDMEEVLGMSDRVLVMHEGRIAGQLARDALSEQSIMQLATGRAPAA